MVPDKTQTLASLVLKYGTACLCCQVVQWDQMTCVNLFGGNSKQEKPQLQ